jgi:uncharacterized protein (PEP-CTERM system associated)
MNNKEPLRQPAEVKSRRPRRLPVRQACAMLAVAWYATPAFAQGARIEPAIRAEVTYSNNGNQAPSGQEQPDVAIEVTPQLLLNYRTARLRAAGTLGVTGTTYIGGNRVSTLYPEIDLTGTLEAVRNFFFIDADIVAQREYVSPFAPRQTSGDANAYAYYAYRVAPYIQGTLPGEIDYFLRNDVVWTYATGTLSERFDEGFEWRIRGNLQTARTRLRAIYEYERDYLKFPNQPKFIVEIGRAVGVYQATPEFSVNLRAGYEWEIFPASEGQGPIYGAGFSWRPTPRTDVTAWWEDRFFGSSWQANLSHRTPWFAAAFTSSRRLATSSENLFVVPRSSDVFRSLDAILTSRVPDPIERAQAIRDLMLVTGLPQSLGQPVAIFSQRIDLQESHVLSLGLLGARNSLVLDGYYVSREGITATGEPLPPPLRIFTDEIQRGASLTYSRRLARSDSINATVLWQRTDGVDLTADAESTQWTTRVQYNAQIRPRTIGYVGARYVVYRSSTVFSDFDEAAAFVGVYHRF